MKKWMSQALQLCRAPFVSTKDVISEARQEAVAAITKKSVDEGYNFEDETYGSCMCRKQTHFFETFSYQGH
jgi:hypothetical protein